MIPTPITSDWIYGGNVVRRGLGHINGGTWSALSYALHDKETNEALGMSMSENMYKRSYRDKSLAGKVIRTWHVGEFQSDDLEEALDVLNAKRAGSVEGEAG